MAQRTAPLIERVLGRDTLALEVMHYRVAEYVGPDSGCHLTVTLRHRDDPDQQEVVEARGVGVVDALFHGLVRHFAGRYGSLDTLTFTGFRVQGQMETAGAPSGLDAEARVEITVQNGHHERLTFEASGRSTLAAALAAVLRLVEHFVNAERAFIVVHRALVDARARRRPDLVERFTAELAMLVDNTSYEDLSRRLKTA
ncbi:MAG: hypothetical protein R3F60_24440 [bacterium]